MRVRESWFQSEGRFNGVMSPRILLLFSKSLVLLGNRVPMVEKGKDVEFGFDLCVAPRYTLFLFFVKGFEGII